MLLGGERHEMAWLRIQGLEEKKRHWIPDQVGDDTTR